VAAGEIKIVYLKIFKVRACARAPTCVCVCVYVDTLISHAEFGIYGTGCPLRVPDEILPTSSAAFVLLQSCRRRRRFNFLLPFFPASFLFSVLEVPVCAKYVFFYPLFPSQPPPYFPINHQSYELSVFVFFPVIEFNPERLLRPRLP